MNAPFSFKDVLDMICRVLSFCLTHPFLPHGMCIRVRVLEKYTEDPKLSKPSHAVNVMFTTADRNPSEKICKIRMLKQGLMVACVSYISFLL